MLDEFFIENIGDDSLKDTAISSQVEESFTDARCGHYFEDPLNKQGPCTCGIDQLQSLHAFRIASRERRYDGATHGKTNQADRLSNAQSIQQVGERLHKQVDIVVRIGPV